jgi:hypothetical protein
MRVLENTLSGSFPFIRRRREQDLRFAPKEVLETLVILQQRVAIFLMVVVCGGRHLFAHALAVSVAIAIILFERHILITMMI